jgi:hypothetical protein
MLSGSFPARSVLALTDTDGTFEVPDPGSPPRELEPQALAVKATREAMATTDLVLTVTGNFLPG